MSMDFIDKIKSLSDRVEKLKGQIQTEEATKNAFIMPFIQVLGYDVFNPLEVVPEFVTDFGAANSEKVDYAIMKDGQPIIIIECKWYGEKLEKHYTQLHKYFHLTKARFAILTNGIEYNFYTDLENANKMDEKPFISFDITNIKEQIANEVKKFHKSYFNIETIINTASELKYTNAIKSILTNEIKSPSENFVKFFVSQVYQGRATASVLEQFTGIVHKSVNQLINDMINDRLQSALDQNTKNNTQSNVTPETENTENKEQTKESKIITTNEELESFLIIKSIIRKKIDVERIFYRDFQNFFSILLDDSIRQTVCRLYLDNNKKQIGLFENKKENKFDFASLNDLYRFEDQLFKAIDNLLTKPENPIEK